MKFDYLSLPELPKDERKLVGFYIDDVYYGLPIMTVREVVNPTDVTRVPSMARGVIGLAEHRDGIIPIVNLRTRFGLPPAERTRRTKWIIARVSEREVGIEVDRTGEVTAVNSSMIKDKPLLTGGSEPWFAEVYQARGILIFELKLSALVTDEVLSIPPRSSEGGNA